MRIGLGELWASLEASILSVVSKSFPRIVFGICQMRLENVFLSCRIHILFHFIFAALSSFVRNVAIVCPKLS